MPELERAMAVWFPGAISMSIRCPRLIFPQSLGLRHLHVAWMSTSRSVTGIIRTEPGICGHQTANHPGQTVKEGYGVVQAVFALS